MSVIIRSNISNFGELFVFRQGGARSVQHSAITDIISKCFHICIHRLVVYCTARSHTALDKALETIGLGMCYLVEVPHDPEQRMIPAELEKLIEGHKKVGGRL